MQWPLGGIAIVPICGRMGDRRKRGLYLISICFQFPSLIQDVYSHLCYPPAQLFDVQLSPYDGNVVVSAGIKHIKFWTAAGNTLTGKKGAAAKGAWGGGGVVYEGVGVRDERIEGRGKK